MFGVTPARNSVRNSKNSGTSPINRVSTTTRKGEEMIHAKNPGKTRKGFKSIGCSKNGLCFSSENLLVKIYSESREGSVYNRSNTSNRLIFQTIKINFCSTWFILTVRGLDCSNFPSYTGDDPILTPI